MLPLHQTLNRSVAAGLAACAIAPAAAVAMPVADAPIVSTGPIILRTPDQATGGGTQPRSSLDQRGQIGPYETADATEPVRYAAPRMAPNTVLAVRTPSTAGGGDGSDLEIWVASLGAGILLATGIGMASRVRVRRHSPA